MGREDWAWVREWSLKIGGTAFLLLVLAFLAGHAEPGSLDSLTGALAKAALPAIAVTLVAGAALAAWCRRKSGGE